MEHDAKEAVPQLADTLKNDSDPTVRAAAAHALGRIGYWAQGAVPQLADALENDPHPTVRMAAAEALGSIGVEAKGAVSQLIESLGDPESGVRRNAAFALGSIGDGAQGAVPQLTKTLKDPDEIVRYYAAGALGNIGEGAKGALPQLVEALNDPDENVRASAAGSIDQLSTILARERAVEYSGHLNTAADIIRNSPDPALKQRADRIQQASDLLKLLWWEQLKQWVVIHPTVSLVVATYPLMLMAWIVLLWLRPLWLLQLNEALAETTDIRLPERLGGFNVAPRYLILVGFFHYWPRVLDAWVTSHISSAQKMFSCLPSVEERKIYVPLPVVVGNESEADLSPGTLRPTFSRSLVCIQIWGKADRVRQA
jgi:HEAT repeat protein